MIKCARVTFGSSGIVYSYFTNIEDLQKGNHVLVDSGNGLGIAKFKSYAGSIPTIARCWVLQKVDLKRLRSNLVIELEESGDSTLFTK